MTIGYAVPIALLNPSLAGGLFVDYLVRGRYPLLLENPPVLRPDDLPLLTTGSPAAQNPDSPDVQSPRPATVVVRPAPVSSDTTALKEIETSHE